MKLIKSIIRPDKVEEAKEVVGRLALSGMTVTAVRRERLPAVSACSAVSRNAFQRAWQVARRW